MGLICISVQNQINTRYIFFLCFIYTDRTLDIYVKVSTSDENLSDVKKEIETTIFKTFDNLEVCKESASANKIHMELTKFGRQILSVRQGSVIITITCETLEALDDLYQRWNTGRLARMFVSAFITNDHPQGVTVTVTIDDSEWARCRQQLRQTGIV